jgi:Holliday junction DNA helicase RuvA
MIARLTGQLAAKELDHVVVDVSGVGYLVSISTNCFYALPEPPGAVTLHVHTAVREDDISLYGFSTALERRVFGLLISVSKVGPKAAMALLSAFQADQMLAAIAAGDARALAKVRGIGAKTAERILVDLTDKAAALLPEAKLAAIDHVPRPARADDDAISALLNLGYRPAEAEARVAEARKTLGESAAIPEVVRAALKRLARE